MFYFGNALANMDYLYNSIFNRGYSHGPKIIKAMEIITDKKPPNL